MKYRYLLVDNDNTLMDFSLAEHRALRETLTACHLPHDDGACALYARLNDALWRALERGETTFDILRVKRFAQLLDHLGPNAAYPAPQALCDAYEACLGTHAELMPGAMALMEALHGHMRIALVSNGLSRIQRGRLSVCPFAPMLDAVIISEELGISKPNPAMVDAALDALGCQDRRQAVFLGDSLTADVAAARAAGIDCIWLAPPGQSSPLPTYTVHSLDEARTLLA